MDPVADADESEDEDREETGQEDQTHVARQGFISPTVVHGEPTPGEEGPNLDGLSDRVAPTNDQEPSANMRDIRAPPVSWR